MRCCFCVFSVTVWFVCALVCDGVWCVCVCVFYCIVCAMCFLLCLNMFVRFVWDVVSADVWFVLAFVFACCASCVLCGVCGVLCDAVCGAVLCCVIVVCVCV